MSVMKRSLLLGVVLFTACANQPVAESSGANLADKKLRRFPITEAGVEVPIEDGRRMYLRLIRGYVYAIDEEDVSRLSGVDFERVHALVGDVTSDDISDVLVELSSTGGGSCYELWLSGNGTLSRYEELICNPSLDELGRLSSMVRDGPYTHASTHATDGAGVFRWVTREEALTHDFSRYKQRLSRPAEQFIVFRGLPQCGAAQVELTTNTMLANAPRGGQAHRASGRAIVLDVAVQDSSGQEWVLVRDASGNEGWVRAYQLGNLQQAATHQCDRYRER
ncbi:hypothetical protein [Novilysobacter erysipheiresistens]|uniref:SH3 domain-containing protein n=1 Tax=Novilysobacter erysipheiresistens TaxID=1749332 RepID=A0ABU7YXH9_9GAMM